MADFAGVLRKTIDGLAENTVEARGKVYQRARDTVEAKLAAASASPEVIARQKELLENAIATVEAEYGEHAEPDALDAPGREHIAARSDVEESAPVDSDAPIEDPASAENELSADEEPNDQAGDDVGDEPFAVDEAAIPHGPETDVSYAADQEAGEAETGPLAAAEERTSSGRRRGRGGVLLLLLVLVLLAVAAYGGWHYRDDLTRIAGLQSPGDGDAQQDGGEASSEVDGEVTQVAAAGGAEPQNDGQDAESPQGAPAVQDASKFTQRLTSDGREIDEGPAGGEPGLGEGTSIAAATQASGALTEGNDQPAEQSVPVGQRAIFYEERTSASEGSAESGNVVWSIAEESPGDNLPPEPVILAEATIPDKDLQLKITIRRNTDQSLPASHIIELIFLTPNDFEGGGISNVLRVAMKRTEQDTGSPLLGIPAKIADGFFLVALSDSRAELEANTTLLRRQSWIDIPIVYTSGRRALITLEKGTAGEEVFSEAMEAWANASSG